MIEGLKIGDRIVWDRDKPVKATVLEVKEHPVGLGIQQRANLRVDGWMGTTWETINHNFKKAA